MSQMLKSSSAMAAATLASRVLGLVPLGGIGFTVGMVYAASGDKADEWFCLIAGFAAGLINVPLASTYQAAVPDDARGNAMSVRKRCAS